MVLQALRKGPMALNMFKAQDGSSSPWIRFAMPNIFLNNDINIKAQRLSEFTKNAAVAFEMKILLNSPQAHWPLLLKIIMMRDSFLSSIIFSHLIEYLPTNDSFKTALTQPFITHETTAEKCKRFLCGKECRSVAEWASTDDDPIGQTNYQVVLALVYVLTATGTASDVKSTFIVPLEQLTVGNWSNPLDRRQVWDQKRPPWFEALHHFVYPILTPIVNIMISSMHSGATIYQVFYSLKFEKNEKFKGQMFFRQWHYQSLV